MSKPDGSIRIDTKIESGNVTSQILKIANAIKKDMAELDLLNAKMDELTNKKIPTEQYKSLGKELEKLVQKQNTYNEQLKEFDGVKNKEKLPLYRELTTKLEDSYDSADKLIFKMRELSEAGKAFTLGRGTEQFSKMAIRAGELSGRIEASNLRLQEMYEKQKPISEQFSKMKKSAQKAFDTISGGAKKSSTLFSTFASRLKGIALSLLVFNWISKGFNAMISGMKKGFENFSGYSDSYANSVQSMKNAMATLGNQFAAAFAPIVQMVIPWLNQLINALSTAMSYVAQFIAALGGSSTFTKAKKIQDSYNKSLDGTAKSAKKAFGALASFDTLEVLNKKDTGDGGSGAADPSQMFTEVPIESSFEKLAQKAKNIFSQLFAPLKDSWGGEGQFVMDSWKFSLQEVQGLVKDVGRDFLEMWGEGETVAVLSDILNILGDIGLTAGKLASGFRTAWNENDTGLRILETVRDIFGDIIGHIRNATGATAEWSAELDFSPLLNSTLKLLKSIEPLSDNIGEGLEWFYTNVLLPLAGWTIEDALPAFLDMLSSSIDTLNSALETFKPLGQWLWDNFLQPLGEWTGGVIVDAMEKIADVLETIGNWVSEHSEAIQALIEIIAPVAGIILLIVNAGTILSGVIGALSLVIGALTSPITLIIAAIAALVVGFIAAYENFEEFRILVDAGIQFILSVLGGFWEGIKTIFGGIGDAVGELINVFNGIITFLTGVFTGDWKKAWSGILEIFKGIFNLIPTTIETVLNLAIDLINGIINGINQITGIVGVPEIPNIPKVKIPRLADGAVIRGGNPFLAVLGDQRAGQTNIEAPLPTIKQAVREELSALGYGASRNVSLTVPVVVNGEALASATIDDLFAEMNRRGYDVDILGWNGG